MVCSRGLLPHQRSNFSILLVSFESCKNGCLLLRIELFEWWIVTIVQEHVLAWIQISIQILALARDLLLWVHKFEIFAHFIFCGHYLKHSGSLNRFWSSFLLVDFRKIVLFMQILAKIFGESLLFPFEFPHITGLLDLGLRILNLLIDIIHETTLRSGPFRLLFSNFGIRNICTVIELKGSRYEIFKFGVWFWGIQHILVFWIRRWRRDLQ